MSSISLEKALRLECINLSQDVTDEGIELVRDRMIALGLLPSLDDGNHYETTSEVLGLAHELCGNPFDTVRDIHRKVRVASLARRLARESLSPLWSDKAPNWHGIRAMMEDRLTIIEGYAIDVDSDATEWFDSHYAAEIRRDVRRHTDTG